MRWTEEGKDLEAWLPYLAAYMGHQKYSSTAWYVHQLSGIASDGRTLPGSAAMQAVWMN